MDEIDSMAPIRGGGYGDSNVTEKVISQLLTELDGLEELKDVVIIGATNRPDLLETALLRPGRFDRMLYIAPPNLEARMEIFKIHTRNKLLDNGVDLKDLVKRTEGYTGADIAAVCNSAVMMVIKEHITKFKDEKQIKEKAKKLKISMRHFEEAMKKVRPLSKDELKRYDETSKRFSETGSKIDKGPSGTIA